MTSKKNTFKELANEIKEKTDIIDNISVQDFKKDYNLIDKNTNIIYSVSDFNPSDIGTRLFIHLNVVKNPNSKKIIARQDLKYYEIIQKNERKQDNVSLATNPNLGGAKRKTSRKNPKKKTRRNRRKSIRRNRH